MEVLIISYQHREYPEFSWSISRESLFQECKRKYYYQYYGSHNGWDEDADKRTREIYRLKKLESIYALVGNLIHRLANKLVEEEKHKRIEIYQQRIKDTLNEHYKYSMDPEYRQLWENKPAKYYMLKEVYFNDGLEQRTIDKINFKIEQCLPHLFRSRSLEEAREAAGYIVIDDIFSNSFNFQGYTIFAVPDLIYHTPEGKPVIVDWKTGSQKPDKDKEQLQLYQYYYRRQYDEDGSVLGRVEYLVAGENEELEMSNEELSRIESRIIKSIDHMRKYVKDGNLEKNQALPEEQYEKSEQQYLCQNCRFYSICD